MYYKRKSGSVPNTESPTSGFNPKSLVVLLNGICVVAGSFYLVSANSSARFFSVVSAILASVLVILANYGLPKISRSAIRQPLQEYFARCMSGAELPFLFFSLMFTNDATSKQLGLIPLGLGDYISVVLIVRRSLWFLGSHGSVAWKGIGVWDRYFQPLWLRLNARTNSIVELASFIEILLGFWFIALLLTPARQLMVCFVYWNFLRIRYLVPRSRASHLTAWSRLDSATLKLRQSVPLLDKPIAFVKNWFNPPSP
jgi:hypothetical protein